MSCDITVAGNIHRVLGIFATKTVDLSISINLNLYNLAVGAVGVSPPTKSEFSADKMSKNFVIIPKKMTEIVLVLGNRNPQKLAKRMTRAIEHFNSSPAVIDDPFFPGGVVVKYLLLSGGSSDGVSKPTGGEMMEKFALSHGVDKKFLIVENDSRNTEENFGKSLDIIEKMFPLKDAFSPLITVCTSTSHITRSMVMAEMILKNYSLKFIHTNEHVPSQEHKREIKNMLAFITSRAVHTHGLHIHVHHLAPITNKKEKKDKKEKTEKIE
jgi:hypothetical protein